MFYNFEVRESRVKSLSSVDLLLKIERSNDPFKKAHFQPLRFCSHDARTKLENHYSELLQLALFFRADIV